MSIFSRRKLGLCVALATLSAGSFTAPVYAADDEELIEEVVVTGSRIPRTGALWRRGSFWDREST